MHIMGPCTSNAEQGAVVEQKLWLRADSSKSSFACHFERNLRRCLAKDSVWLFRELWEGPSGHVERSGAPGQGRASISSLLAPPGRAPASTSSASRAPGQAKPGQQFLPLWRHWGKPRAANSSALAALGQPLRAAISSALAALGQAFPNAKWLCSRKHKHFRATRR